MSARHLIALTPALAAIQPRLILAFCRELEQPCWTVPINELWKPLDDFVEQVRDLAEPGEDDHPAYAAALPILQQIDKRGQFPSDHLEALRDTYSPSEDDYPGRVDTCAGHIMQARYDAACDAVQKRIEREFRADMAAMLVAMRTAVAIVPVRRAA